MIQPGYQLIDEVVGGQVCFLDNGLERNTVDRTTFTIIEGHPLSATSRSDWTIKIGRGDWQTRVETSSRMSAGGENFYVSNILDAYEGNTRVFTKTWHFSTGRDLV